MAILQKINKTNGHKIKTSLSPSQQKAFNQVIDYLDKCSIVELIQFSNFGKTTVLQALAYHLNGKYLRLSDFFQLIQEKDAFKIEEAIYETIYQAFRQHDLVIIDDFSQVEIALADNYSSSRRNGLETFVIDALDRLMANSHKKLILGIKRSCRTPKFYNKSLSVNTNYLEPEDYDFFFQHFGGTRYRGLDYNRVHQHAARLNINQIKKACLLIEEKPLTTEALLSELEKHAIVSNVNREEVEKVTLKELKGVEEVIHQLEIDVINPLENPEIAVEYGMEPKRGVLLYGPPGTGKTTIGRALAHRLKSKFFLIDGTIISGTGNFYTEVNRIISFARNNAPSIVFIDDCDLLLESGKDEGFYRYLLTILDGLESKTNKSVTVMMTTMHLSSIPDALIRSGRVELWLEMKLPNKAARASILENHLAKSKLQPNAAELNKIVLATDGFTGADLKRLVSDAQNLYGFDVINKNKLKLALHYFETALKRLKKLRKQFYRTNTKGAGQIGF